MTPLPYYYFKHKLKYHTELHRLVKTLETRNKKQLDTHFFNDKKVNELLCIKKFINILSYWF